VQEREDGLFTLTRDGDDNVTSEVRVLTSRRTRFSTNLAGVTLANFPAGWSFGNGITIGVMVPLDTGPRLLSWAVFPDASEAAVNTNFAALQALMES